MDIGNGFRLRRTLSSQAKDEDQPDKYCKYFNYSPLRPTAVATRCTVSGALALVLRVSRVVGIAPLDMQQQHSGSWEIRVSKTAYVYSVVLISVLNIIALSALSMDFSVGHDHAVRTRSPFKSIVWLMDFTAVILTNNVFAYAAPATMQAMICILSRIQKINADINHFVPTHVGKRQKIVVVIFFSLFTFVFVFNYYISCSLSLHKNRNMIVVGLYSAYYCLCLNLTLINLQFGLTVLTTNYTLKTINYHLDRLWLIIKDKGNENIEESPSKERHEIQLGITVPLTSINIVIDKITSIGDILPKKMSHAETVRTLGLSYVDVSDLIEELNNCFGVVTMMMLITTIIHLTITPYYLLTLLFTRAEANMYVMLQILWCIKHLLTMLLLVEPCHRTYQELNRTRKLMEQLSRRTAAAAGPLVSELRKFFWCIYLNKAQYSPMGVCTLARPLCVTILGAVTTYLFVAIQFNTKDDTNDSYAYNYNN